MYEAHRPHGADSSEVFLADQPPPAPPTSDAVYLQAEVPDDRGAEEDIEIERAGEFPGDIFLMKPKRPLKPRNAPGAAAAAQKGAVNHIRNYPNKTPQKGTTPGKGAMMCWRCGSPDHFWKDCPLPYSASLPFRSKSKGRGKSLPARPSRPQTVRFNSAHPNEPTPPSQAECTAPTEVPLCCHAPVPEEAPSAQDYPPDPDGSTDPRSAFYAQRARGDSGNFYSSRAPRDCLHLYPTDLALPPPKSCINEPSLPIAVRLPVLIDSGASGTVVGLSWLRQWLGRRGFSLEPPARSFRSGDGELASSMGKYNAALYLTPSVTNAKSPQSITVSADVVPAEVPLLTPKQSLDAMSGKLAFSKATLCILNGSAILLKNLASGHISLPAVPQGEIAKKDRVDEAALSRPVSVFTVGNSNELIPVTDAELGEIHKRLAHCSEFTITNLLKAGMRAVDSTQIQRVLQNAPFTAW